MEGSELSAFHIRKAQRSNTGASLLFYSQDISTSHSIWIVVKGDKVPTEPSIARNIFLLKLHPQEVASTNTQHVWVSNV